MAELMKGKKWAERKHLVKYPVLAENKHDEIRCHVIVQEGDVQFLSYAGKPLANMEMFKSMFAVLASETGHREFDLGFEVNGNFNDSYRWVRSTKALPSDLYDAKITWYLFDLPLSMKKYIERRPEIVQIAKQYNLSYPKGVVCTCADDVDVAYERARENKFEGLMIKTQDHVYQRGKRTDGWLKYKPSEEADGTIIEVIEAVSEEGMPLGRAGSLRIQCEDGSVAQPHGIAHALATEMWEQRESYIGQYCEFKYMERDRAGGYRHPVFHRLREQ